MGSKRETEELLAKTKREIAELQERERNKAQKVISESQLDVSKINSQIRALQQEFESQSEADCTRLRVDAEAFHKKKQVEASIEYASKIANGNKALGEAEGEAAVAFQAKRAFEAEMKRLDILQTLVTKHNMTIATSSENTAGMNPDNAVVTQVGQQGLEALRAKLAEVTASALSKLEVHKPSQHRM